MLDIGFIPVILFLIAIFKSIFCKEKPLWLKQILLSIVLHIIIDFDLQFMIIFLILVMTMNLWDGKKYEYEVNNKVLITALSICSIIYLYFGLVTVFHYFEKDEIAVNMYPIYTESNIAIANKYCIMIDLY